MNGQSNHGYVADQSQHVIYADGTVRVLMTAAGQANGKQAEKTEVNLCTMHRHVFLC